MRQLLFTEPVEYDETDFKIIFFFLFVSFAVYSFIEFCKLKQLTFGDHDHDGDDVHAVDVNTCTGSLAHKRTWAAKNKVYMCEL